MKNLRKKPNMDFLVGAILLIGIVIMTFQVDWAYVTSLYNEFSIELNALENIASSR